MSFSDLIRAKSKVAGDNPSDRSSRNSDLKSRLSLGPTRVAADFLSNDFHDFLCRCTLRSSIFMLILHRSCRLVPVDVVVHGS